MDNNISIIPYIFSFSFSLILIQLFFPTILLVSFLLSIPFYISPTPNSLPSLFHISSLIVHSVSYLFSIFPYSILLPSQSLSSLSFLSFLFPLLPFFLSKKYFPFIKYSLHFFKLNFKLHLFLFFFFFFIYQFL